MRWPGLLLLFVHAGNITKGAFAVPGGANENGIHFNDGLCFERAEEIRKSDLELSAFLQH